MPVVAAVAVSVGTVLGALPGVAAADVARASAVAPLSYLTAVACPSASQCTAVGRDLEFTFDPATPGEPAATIIVGDTELSGLACPATSQCTAVDSAGEEITFNPLAPGVAKPAAIDSGGALTAVACPSAGQCTAVDDMGREITFDPVAPRSPTPTAIDQARTPGTLEQDRLTAVACPATGQCTAVDDAGLQVTFNPAAPDGAGPVLIAPAPAGTPFASLTGVACPALSQCAAVDTAGRETAFDPTFPGSPSPAIVYPSGLASANPLTASSNTLSAIACPSAGQCTAVGYQREFTFEPAEPAIPKPATIAAESITGVACPGTARCTAVDSTGQEITFDPIAPLLPNPIRIDSVAVTPRASVSAGRASVPLTCGFHATEPCRVTLRLLAPKAGGRTTTLAGRTLTVPIGHDETVTLTLGAACRRLLSAAHRLTVTLSVTERESDELRWTTDQALVFTARARHHR
jgi:hypothetical protein